MKEQCTCDPVAIDGHPYIQFIGTWFGDCVRTPAEIASFTSGLLSLLCYIVALFPQMWMNYKRKSVEGLSAGLIFIWAFGDMCNLTGAILTNQLRTQVFVATVFVAVDVVIVFQYLWYTNLRVVLFGLQPRAGTEREPLLPPHTGESVDGLQSSYNNPSKPRTGGKAASTLSLSSNDETVVSSTSSRSSEVQTRSMGTAAVAGAVAVSLAGLVDSASGFPVTLFGFHDVHAVSSFSLMDPTAPRLCDQRLPLSETAVMLGSVAAWCSGLLYFFSRMPQIAENAKKKSVEGLSLGLFIFTLSGNFTYGLSILLRGPTFDWQFVRSDLPYVIGSIGVLCFDIVILTQAYFFGELKWENL
ncbi:PQ loop repeat-domain-containing protein [Chytridium lagenaria]|nr:PQ loop repeat-domain-containing protein [Chytridium lagenaria]